jgi:hypothetical protein
MITKEEQLNYFRSRILKLIASYEMKTKLLWHESDLSELESEFFEASDSKNLIRLKSIHNKICKALDEVNQ